MINRMKGAWAVIALLALLAGQADATLVTFDGAAANNNDDIPFDYGSFVAGNATGFITTDGSGATPHIGLNWVGNLPNEWEYHTAGTWVHESPVAVVQIDHNRDSAFDDVTDIVFKPIDGRSVVINSFMLTGANDHDFPAEFHWEVVGTAVGGDLTVAPASNTGTVAVNYTGTPGRSETLRLTLLNDDNTFGTALDNLSFSELLAPGAPVFSLTVDRSTGAVSLTNVGTTPITIKGYSITSEAGGLNQSGWKTIAGNYDMSGNDSVDGNDDWTRLSQAGDPTDFSEYEFGGDGASLAPGVPVLLSQAGGNAWLKSPIEDLALDIVLASGDIFQYSVQYINGPAGGYQLGDLNFDGAVNLLDWPAYNSGRGVDMSSMSQVQAYRLGDLDGDFDNDIADFVLFKDLVTSALAAERVPEPSGVALLLVAGGLLAVSRRGRSTHLVEFNYLRSPLVKTRYIAACLIMLAFIAVMAGSAQATILTFSNNASGFTPGNNSDLEATYGSNVTAENIIGAIEQGEGFTPNIALSWAPAGGPPLSPTGDILEYHSATTFSGAGFSVPVVQFDLDISQHSELPADPTIDFLVDGGKALKLHSFEIGNATDQSEPSYSWTINLIRLSDMATVATQTTGILGAGSRETVTFDYIGTTDEDYRLHFDDGGANTVRSAIDNLKFSETIGGVTPQLRLEVSTTTGLITLINDSGQDFTIDSYEITSASGSLDPLNWGSLQDRDLEGNGAPGTGNGWEEAGGVNASQLIESFLDGDSTISNGSSLSLAQAFDFNKPGAMEDLQFGYHVAGTGGFLTGGAVSYVTPTVDADFDNDGDVDGRDFLTWQHGFGLTGSSATNANGNADGDGDIDGDDLVAWKAQRGMGTPLSATAAVPEPGSFSLLLVAGMAWLAGRRRSSDEQQVAISTHTRLAWIAGLAAVGVLLAAQVSMAAKSTDRRYEFGDGGSNSLQDSQFVNASQDKQDLSVPAGLGSPSFVNVSSTGLNRPGANVGDNGAQFDGVNDALKGVPLNRPDETAGPDFFGIGPLLFPFPYNYNQIITRGLQMWVYPDASALGTEESPTQRQGIVFDTRGAGGVSITADGKWTQSFASSDSDGSIGATFPVVGNQWVHVMQHIYHVSQPGFPTPLSNARSYTGVVYVNGIAVSASNGTVFPGQLVGSTLNPTFVGELVVGAQEIANDGFDPLYDHHFKGVIDDLQMYVYGDNSSDSGPPAGQNYGTFDLFADNDWIADQVAALPGGQLKTGDVNRDGDIDEGDVTAFVSGWKKEKRFEGAVNEVLVGDWETWGWGDLNLDGQVNLTDAILLDESLSLAGFSGGLDFSLLGATVPEPATGSSTLLLLLASVCRRSRRRVELTRH